VHYTTPWKKHPDIIFKNWKLEVFVLNNNYFINKEVLYQ